MGKIRAAINNVNLKRFRFWLQIGFFALFVYGGYLAINLGNSLPTFSCAFNNDGRGGVCFLMPIQHLMATRWSSLFGYAGLGVLTAFLTFALWFIVLNKGWCGYACPLGTIQDWISSLRTRLGIRSGRYTKPQFRSLSSIKYVLLALTLLIPLGIGGGYLPHSLGTPFCDICPGRMILPLFTGDTSQLTIDFSSKTAMIMTALGMLITGLFFTGAFIKKRFFCFFCPMSALHYLFSKPALLNLRKDGDKCTRCGDCYRVCDMQIREIADDVDNPRIMKDDCILCFKCVAACPEEGALKVTFVGLPIFEATEAGFNKRMNQGKPSEQPEQHP
ncbi:MAG: 4Fe-4S binding protein [Candidatus Thiodiazotropha sp.]|jgi:ferredoxin-type protein NapH